MDRKALTNNGNVLNDVVGGDVFHAIVLPDCAHQSMYLDMSRFGSQDVLIEVWGSEHCHPSYLE